ncbi:unnamed protein product [Arabis nemorensis]|uniref:Uncharacterized protein n=1 Tax=Arabis nemorensis TaxID=586526 RepID=A0A565C3M0_9BRAS|nr:unnamed protein product [Arabis nemorensis]
MGLQRISMGLRTGCKEAVEFLERISTFEGICLFNKVCFIRNGSFSLTIGLGALSYPYAINIYKFAYLLRRYWPEKEQDNLLNNPDILTSQVA